MPSWKTANSGLWLDAANWNGGIPNAPGAIAEFTIANAGEATMFVEFSQGVTVTVGTLNLVTDADDGWLFRGAAGVTDATLRFQNPYGGPATINVDTHGSRRAAEISGVNGLKVAFDSSVVISTASESTLTISAPITGNDLFKFGDGTLRLSGDNKNWGCDAYLYDGRTELATALSPNSYIRMYGEAVLVATGSFTLGNRIDIGSGFVAAKILVATGETLTLSGKMTAHDTESAFVFGGTLDAGTIVLSGTSDFTGQTTTPWINGGTVRFGNADAAANYFAHLPGTKEFEVRGTLDTNGFAATVDNLALKSGKILSSSGALDLTVDSSATTLSWNFASAIQGTGSVDRVVFNIVDEVNLAGVTLLNWNKGVDTVTINGGQGSNSLSGTEGDDLINGNGGNDTLRGSGGADHLIGGIGDDEYQLNDGLDTLVENPGDGTDTVRIDMGGPTAFTLAENFENLLFNNLPNGDGNYIGNGNAVANVITGASGNDRLNGLGGADTLVGKGGSDFYYVDNALDKVIEAAGEGNDRVFASVGYTLAAGQEIENLNADPSIGDAAINLTGNEIANTITGNNGANMLDGKVGADTMVGLGGDDFFFVENVGDKAVETVGEGNDRIFASVTYVLATGTSVETITTVSNVGTLAINLTGNEIANTMVGNAGANTLNGGGGADLMAGLVGDDFYFVDNAGDRAAETDGQGNDRVFAAVSWVLNAGDSVETITTTASAGTTAINLTGNAFAQTIAGNNGVNILDGKGGNDILMGGTGADQFAFTTALGASNVDRITDFQAGVDKVAVDNAVFTAVGADGALNANAFVVGTAAADADDRIVYNQATGQLFYDADGLGGAAAVLFATLDAKPMLTAGDFTVI